MSALNAAMVRPILSSHTKLRLMLDRATPDNLEELMLQDSQSEVVAPLPALGPVAQHRLQRLTGLKPDPAQLERIAAQLGQPTLEAFRACTEGARSWYGTYVANALGSGLRRALGASANSDEVLTGLIRVVASAAQCYEGPRQEWALGALQPALQIQSSPEQARKLLQAANALVTPEQGAELLSSRTHPLTARSGNTGVALELRD